LCGYDDSKEIDRPQQYLKTGKLVADSSLILIALWDGKAGKKGGTADIVKHKITGDDDTVAESTFEYDGTVFVLPAKGQNHHIRFLRVSIIRKHYRLIIF